MKKKEPPEYDAGKAIYQDGWRAGHKSCKDNACVIIAAYSHLSLKDTKKLLKLIKEI